jgi:hypothetical protein
MKKCKCGQMVASNARFCPHCGNRFTHPFTKLIAWFFGIVIVMAFIGAIVGGSGSTPAASNTDSVGRAVSASVTSDAELLIYRCGKPDKDDSTAYDNPRPPIPSRLITYRKAHLMFAYIPGGGANLGDPPPYKWEFVGVKDTRTNKPITAAQMKATLSSRLPCFEGK